MCALKTFSVVLLALFLAPSVSCKVVYVRPNATSKCPPGELCLKLEEYAVNVTNYFTPGTEVIFLSGEHTLNRDLTICSIANITLTGNKAKIILAESGVIKLVETVNITLNVFQIEFTVTAFDLSYSNSTAITNVNFIPMSVNNSTMINCHNSTAKITNVSFPNAKGQFINALSCNISFFGNNSFTNNSEYDGIGVIYAEYGAISFNGVNTFEDIEGVLVMDYTRLEFNGMVVFRRSAQCIDLYGGEFHINGTVIFNDNRDSFSVFDTVVKITGVMNFTNNNGTLDATYSDVSMKGNISFIDNYGGAVSIQRSTLRLEENVWFINNTSNYDGGGIYAWDSDIKVNGYLLFENNRARRGGAVMFDENSHLVLQGRVAMDFINNTADYGGALFFADPESYCEVDKKEPLKCFFTLSANSVNNNKLKFSSNSAKYGGNVLYGGAIDQCTVDLGKKDRNVSPLTVLKNISTIMPRNDLSNIISDPKKICLCKNKVMNCSLDYLSVVRGKTIKFFVVSVGQFDIPVPSTITTHIKDPRYNFQIFQSYTIKAECSEIDVTLFGNANFNLVLYPNSSCQDTYKYIQVYFESCPPGFEIKGYQCICEKRLLNLNKSNECYIESGLIGRPNNAWIKPMWNDTKNYTGFIFSKFCPLGYCNDKIKNLTFSFAAGKSAIDAQCNKNRSGTLCGECKGSHSVTLNTFHCKSCDNAYISLFVLFAFAGVLLIVILTGLQMTVAAGTINGLILYVNIVSANKNDIFFPEEVKCDYVKMLSVFISWLNLDFGIESCLFDGLDLYTYVWLQYVFPVYLWFLMGMMILCSRRSAIVLRLLGSNPVAVLATLILMSYTKLLRNIVTALSYTELEYPPEVGNNVYVWTYNGSIKYFEGHHKFLASFSLFVSLFIFLPFTFFIMFGYSLLAFSDRRCFTWLNRFKPLLDAYYGPYRKETRYWTGFMLLLRFCLYLIFAFFDLGNPSVSLLAILVVFSFIALLSRNRLYEKLSLDILEGSFVLNICLLTAVTFYIRSTVKETKKQQDLVVIMSCIFVGVAFVECVGIIIYHIFSRILKFRCAQQLRAKIWKTNEPSGDTNLPLIIDDYVHERET